MMRLPSRPRTLQKTGGFRRVVSLRQGIARTVVKKVAEQHKAVRIVPGHEAGKIGGPGKRTVQVGCDKAFH